MRVDTDRHERDQNRRPGGGDEPPAPPAGEDDERDGEQRAEEAASRVRVGDEPDESPGDDAVHDVVALRAARSARARGGAARRGAAASSPRSPSARARTATVSARRGRRRPSPRTSSPLSRQASTPEQQHGRENERRREPARDLLIGPGELEDTGEQVRVDGALVVVERPEEQREASAVLVAKPSRQRVGVERERASSRW